MRKKHFLFLAVFAVFGAFPFHYSAQDRSENRNSITGFVFDESRRPVDSIYVELQSDFYSTLARIRTRGSGTYSFAGLPAAQYVVKIITIGTEYEEQSKSVSLVPISPIQGRGTVSEQVDFYLKVRRTKSGITPSAPGVIYVQEVPDEAKALYEAGVADLGSKNDTAGLDKIKRSIEAFPDYFVALDRLASEYVSRGFYEPAFVLFTKALQVNPRSFTSTAGLGLAEYRLGRAEAAAARFKEAVKMDKTSVNAHLWLGIALHATNKLPAALSALSEANKLSEGANAEIHWQLARVYKDQKKYQLAADALNLYLKHKPDAENAAEIRKVIATLREKV